MNENILKNGEHEIEDFKNNITSDLIIKIIKQNQDFKEIIIEQNKQNQELTNKLVDVYKNNSNTNITNSNFQNRKYRLTLFVSLC